MHLEQPTEITGRQIGKQLCHPPVTIGPLDPFLHHRIAHRGAGGGPFERAAVELAVQQLPVIQGLADVGIAPAIARANLLRPPQMQIQQKVGGAGGEQGLHRVPWLALKRHHHQ